MVEHYHKHLLIKQSQCGKFIYFFQWTPAFAFEHSKHAFVLLSFAYCSTSGLNQSFVCETFSFTKAVDRTRSRSVVCWQERDFKVLRPSFIDLSAPSHVSFYKEATTCLVQSSFGLPDLRLKGNCNDRSEKKCCLQWDNIHQFTDDNIWWQNIDVNPKCVCAKVLLRLSCLWTGSVWFGWKCPSTFEFVENHKIVAVNEEPIKGVQQAGAIISFTQKQQVINKLCLVLV